MAHRPNLAHHLIGHIKFSFNTAVTIRLYVIYGCFHAVTAELSSFLQRMYDLPILKYLFFWPFKESLPTPDLYFAALYTKQRLISPEIP